MHPLIPLAILSFFPTLPTPEERALAFLAREVPSWSAENNCYSCHNNGDAARALYRAKRLSLLVPAKSLEDTTRWLMKPAGWDDNSGKDGQKNIGLARVQFAAALLEAMDAGLVEDRQPLARAAELVAEVQQKDGAWRPDGEEVVGSPTTYGPALMTHQARRILLRADAERHREAVARADRWLRQTEVKTVLDAAAVLLALEGSPDTDAEKQRRHCLELIRQGQSRAGGWGPYVGSPAEAFDTAVVLLALAGRNKDKDVAAMLERGRAYLIALQQKDGSWPTTTRPAGAESYAQHISTNGWATLALLAGRP